MFQIRNKTVSAFALCAIAVFGLYGCGSDNIVDNGKDKEGQEQELPKVMFTGGLGDEGTKSRTGGVEDATKLDFVWTANDYKYFFVDLGSPQNAPVNWKAAKYMTPIENDAGNDKIIKKASFYYEDIPLTDQSYTYALRYVGGSNNPNQVRIKNIQKQTGTAGFADQLGENGDCFIAYAYGWQRAYNVKKSDGTTFSPYINYYFNPNGGYNYRGQSYQAGHKASYISFMVYNLKGEMKNTYISQVKITADQGINGTRPFSEAGIDLTSRPTSALNRSTRLEISDGLSIAANRADARKKAAVMVAFPGEYTNVKVEIKIFDPVSNVYVNIDRTYAKMKLEEGKNLPLYFSLDFPDFGQNFETYHMWGAKDYYWMPSSPLPTPHNWVITGGVGSIAAPAAPNDVWPKLDTDTRWYEKDNFEVQSGTVDYTSDVPKPNDASYILTQDCYWDNTTAYVIDGHLFKGLLWMPKIIKGHSNAYDGNDWSAASPSSGHEKTVKTGVHNVSGYFAVPALGWWVDGALSNVGKEGRYWLWDCDPDDTDNNAYSVYFNSQKIIIQHDTPKKYGCLSMPKGN